MIYVCLMQQETIQVSVYIYNECLRKRYFDGHTY